MAHYHAARIARQPLGRLRGNVRAVLDDRLPRRIRIREHRGIDVDHDLVTLARSTWVDSMVKRRLGHEGECVRLLLLNRRRFWRPVLVSRFRGTVHELRFGGTVGGAVRPDPLTQRLSCRRDCLNEHSTRLRLQPRADDHHTVVVVIHMQGAVFVPARRLLDFHLAIHPAPAADDTFNVLSRAGQEPIRYSGYYPLTAAEVRQELDKLR